MDWRGTSRGWRRTSIRCLPRIRWGICGRLFVRELLIKMGLRGSPVARPMLRRSRDEGVDTREATAYAQCGRDAGSGGDHDRAAACAEAGGAARGIRGGEDDTRKGDGCG